MTSESPQETPVPRDAVGSVPNSEDATQVDTTDSGTLPAKLSQFIKRLASFGLGEGPDPLLTDARPQSKRRSQR